ncbi:MAG: AAA family ATPase, partial [Mariniblastus sp.]|nr:AAA family ATPase [Mariniblastus sp.]
MDDKFEQQAEQFRKQYETIKDEVGKVIVGHDEIVHGVLTCMMIGGHCLLEGAPGLGKTLLVRTLSEA